MPPRRPAILIPLKTREGVAEAPTEPGLRTLWEPCEVGPRLKLCRLIVPANPLPIETPDTLTLSPTSKLSTVTASPSVAPVRPRSSSRCLCGATPFFNGYRPQFYFRTTDVTGSIKLPEGQEMVMPGDNTNMEIELGQPIAMDQGLRFAIREGGRTVGAGVVTEIQT